MAASARAKRQGKTLLIVLVSVFLVLAVVVAWRLSIPATEPDFEEGRAVAEKFLSLLRTGAARQAWESTTAEFKSAEGRESFEKSVKKNAQLTMPSTFVSVQTVTVQNHPRAEYLFRTADGRTSVRLLAGNDRGTWRVDRMTVN